MNAETFQAQYPLALQALGLHMQAHDLPVPTSVDVIEYHHFATRQPSRAIRVRLPHLPDQQDAWIASVAVDGTDVEEVEFGFRTTWSVRLPDTGFRFELVGLRAQASWMPVSA
jgi:hypothetical protein